MHKDENGILRMPFNPPIVENEEIPIHQCSNCQKEFKLTELKELMNPADRTFIYWCRSCYFSSPISDASNWTA